MKDPVTDLHLGLKELAAEDRTGWAPLALSERLRDVVGLSEATQVELIRTLAGWDHVCAWSEDGAVTAVAWLKHDLGMAPGEAAALVHLARFTAQHRCVADALDDHRLRVAAARQLLKASRRREEPFAACVNGLLKLGCELPYEQFAAVIAQWIDLVDDQAPADDTKRRMTITDVSEQSVTQLVGGLDDAAIVRAALEAMDHPDPEDAPDGPRTREQRWYDLTIDLFRRALADKLGDDPMTVGGADVIVDAQTAAEATSQDPPSLDDQLAPFADGDADTLLSRRCEHPDGRPVSRAFLAALLCSGFIRRIVVDPHTGQTLDLGRAVRRFNKRQFRAFAIRDGGCAFPGCDRKPQWCDAHHLRWWDDGGRTDLDNGCLLCRRHHTLIHHGGWRLERDRRTGIFTATAPDGRTFTRRPGQRR
jgi:hypothetical protein